MSEVIVRMEMPENCWCCPNGQPDWIYNDDGTLKLVCFCNICNTKEDDKWISETETERPSWCPIKGVLPDEHGRIIDEAVFCENVVKYSHQSTKTIGKALDATPTIIDMTPIVAERSET